jgi:KTSC domain
MAVLIALEWVAVESGLFAAAAYRDSARQLYLRFCDGNIYRYFDCPESVYKEFLAAESKGKYFSQHIRNRFRDGLVYRNTGGSPRESLEQQLSSSVALAEGVLTSAMPPRQPACTSERAE